MSRTIYPALSGATATLTQMEVISNNLANASTTGFKRSRVTFGLEGPTDTPFGQAYAKALSEQPFLGDGSVISDGNPTHVALQGPGFFVVQGGSGPLLTRDGSFQTDQDGRLITSSGFAVMGQGGPIEIPPGETLSISPDGRIFGNISGELDTLRLVNASIRPTGGNYFIADGALTEATPHVEQGALEGSNVDPMNTMVELMEASRYFEAFQKAMQASDDLDSRLNRLGGS